MAKPSFEEKVEDYYKNQLSDFKIPHFAKTESVNAAIDAALLAAESKQGGSGRNIPDIKLLAELPNRRVVPVMMEAKGAAGKLVRFDKTVDIQLVTAYPSDGAISKKTGEPSHRKGDKNYSTVAGYAVNGAVWYANAILEHSDYEEAIAVGVNGYEQDGEPVYEMAAYYVSERNNRMPKKLEGVSSFAFLKQTNLPALAKTLDELFLTDEERERITRKTEEELERHVKSIHQRLYDAEDLRVLLGMNDKLYLFCGLIMAGLPIEGQAILSPADLHGNNSETANDGTRLLERIREFLRSRGRSEDKVSLIVNLMAPVFTRHEMWKTKAGGKEKGESLLKDIFRQVSEEVVPYLDTNFRLDFTGKILNSLNDWAQIENDQKNDVVLTPRIVTNLMAQLARTDMNSFVWDSAAGSCGFLVSALDIMERDAEAKIQDAEALVAKKENIHTRQLLGIEILGNMYILAVLNMILMGDGSSNVIRADSFTQELPEGFPANVFLLNPPYSAPGKGLNFVARAVKKMTHGYACVLIQENAGSGNGGSYATEILRHATLEASIHMPNDLFHGKSSVQTAIYLFRVGRPHETDDLVTFIDFSNDGYTRSARRKSSQEVNLRDTDDAKGRYAELVARVLGKKTESAYYTEENGLLIRDSITLEGNDWTFAQHKKVDLAPTEDDFRKTVADYLAWRVSQVIKGGV